MSEGFLRILVIRRGCVVESSEFGEDGGSGAAMRSQRRSCGKGVGG